jgi:hypothetical protein
MAVPKELNPSARLHLSDERDYERYCFLLSGFKGAMTQACAIYISCGYQWQFIAALMLWEADTHS